MEITIKEKNDIEDIAVTSVIDSAIETMKFAKKPFLTIEDLEFIKKAWIESRQNT